MLATSLIQDDKGHGGYLGTQVCTSQFFMCPWFSKSSASFVIMDGLPSYFQRRQGANPDQHLITFHQCMDQLDIHHEDVLMKMFMYSLKGDA